LLRIDWLMTKFNVKEGERQRTHLVSFRVPSCELVVSAIAVQTETTNSHEGTRKRDLLLRILLHPHLQHSALRRLLDLKNVTVEWNCIALGKQRSGL
jgi:hypothetical protein